VGLQKKAAKSLEAALSFAENTNVVEMKRGKILSNAAEILSQLSLPGKEHLLSKEYKEPPPFMTSPEVSMSLSLDTSNAMFPETINHDGTLPTLTFPPRSSSPSLRPDWTKNLGIDKAAEIKAFQKDSAASKLDFRPSVTPTEKRKLLMAERSLSTFSPLQSLNDSFEKQSKIQVRPITSPTGQTGASSTKATEVGDAFPRPGTAVLQDNGLISIYGEQKAWHHQPPLEPVYPRGSAEEAAALALKHPASVPKLVRANTPNRRSKFKTDKGAVPPMYAPYVLVKPGTFSSKKKSSVSASSDATATIQALGTSTQSNPRRNAYYDSEDDGEETESVIHMNDVVSKAISRIELEVARRREAAEAAKEEERAKAARMKRLAAERAAKAEGRTLPSEEEEAKAAEKLAVEKSNFTAIGVNSSESLATERSYSASVETGVLAKAASVVVHAVVVETVAETVVVLDEKKEAVVESVILEEAIVAPTSLVEVFVAPTLLEKDTVERVAAVESFAEPVVLTEVVTEPAVLAEVVTEPIVLAEVVAEPIVLAEVVAAEPL
jgi:hypothetical protein